MALLHTCVHALSPSALQDHYAWFNREELTGVEHNPGPTAGRYGFTNRNRGRGARRSDSDPRRLCADQDVEAGALAASLSTSVPTSGSLARPWLTPDKSLSQLAEAIHLSMLSPAFRTLSAVVSHLRDHPEVLSFTVEGTSVYYPSVDITTADDPVPAPAASASPTVPTRPQQLATPIPPAAHTPAPLVATRPRHKQTLAESIAAHSSEPAPKRPRLSALGESPAHTPSMDRPLAPQPHAIPADEELPSDGDDVDSLMRELAHDAAHPRRNIRERAPPAATRNPYADLSPSDLEDHRLEIEHLIRQARAAQAPRAPITLPR